MTTFCQRVESDRAYVVYKSLSNVPDNTSPSWLWLWLQVQAVQG